VRRVDASTANDQLRGVAAISAGNAYAVGVAAPAHSAVEQTLILHWNGHSWARVSSPDPAGTSGINDLQGAAAGGGAVPVFACGAGLGTGTVCATAATAIRLARMVHATAARLAFRIAPSAPLRRVPARYGNLTT